ncbi:MAG: substrate-binding domain-containing protein [Verrucomicrobia bacterium]|nr:substrate-binding domain-containing protein [Verrucomicrobiota bacterium]
MNRIPSRISLITQTINILREDLKSCAEFLPSERFWADQLKVSRPTLRAALAALRREGLIRVIPGQGSRVVPQQRPIMPRSSSKVVGFLSATATHLLPTSERFFIGELRRHMQQAGYELQVFADGRLRWRRPQLILKNLVRQRSVCCWLLRMQRLPVQRWFADQQMPSIVVGSCYENIHLPSIDTDHRAVTRHAAGLLLGMGHQRITLLMRQWGLAGDLESEQGFREAFQTSAHSGAIPSVIYHNQTLEHIRNRLNSIFYSKNRPTAMIVSHSQDALTALTWLMHMGFHVPKDVAMISRSDDEFLSSTIPQLARYVSNWDDFARKLFHLVIRLISAGELTTQKVRMMPRCFKGETLAKNLRGTVATRVDVSKHHPIWKESRRVPPGEDGEPIRRQTRWDEPGRFRFP